MRSFVAGILLFILLLNTMCYAQVTEQFDIYSFNKKYLEHLVKTGVDSVRKLYKCEPLINDSILYLASSHHANYLVRTGKLSHIEDDSSSTKTPQDRAEHYGAGNYRVGENILVTPYNKIVEEKDKRKFDTHSYQGIADAMVSAWVHSSGHFKNMITADYQLTGLSVSMDTITGKLYACQKFAIADYQYIFSENKEMFPYSNYQPPQMVNSFDGIKKQLAIDYTYDFKLRHDKPEYCASCEQEIANSPPITLRVERNAFILRIEDSEYVKNLMVNKYDGFAVEIVSFNDYMCGNSAYYTKPSRRNEQLMLNGKIIKPLYWNELYKGYKKRQKRKDVKFVPYIFKSDSLTFFKRFGRYKIDRFNSEYFEIPLGKVPQDINGLWAHNLVYIQDRQICHIDYFTGYCGEVIEEYQPDEFIPCSAVDHCVLKPEERSLHFSIPFEQGKSDFTKADIGPFIQSISNLSYVLDSVHIHAYSSIEGDSGLNRNLQIMRSKNIADVLKQNQNTETPVRIITSADWIGFYKSIAKHPKWKYLSAMNKTEVLNELNKIGFDEIEPILKTERRGEIDLYYTIKVNDQNLTHLLTKELNLIQHRIDSLTRAKQVIKDHLEEFNLLYECIHSKVVQGKLSAEFLATVKMPRGYHDNHPLTQNFILYGYEFMEAFDKNRDWKENHKKDEDYIQASCNDPLHIKPEFQYLLIRNAIKDYQEQKMADYNKLQFLLDEVSRMENFHQTDSIAQINIDRLNFNLNILLLNTVFEKEHVKYSGNAIKSIAQLQQFYEKHHQMDAGRAIALGKTAVYFEQINNAIALMSPYAIEDSILAYMMTLAYQHISSEGAIEWYNTILALSDKMDSNIWCDMFIGECKIPFQAFDYEPLRNIFCERCITYNDFLSDLMSKKKSKTTNRNRGSTTK